MLLVYLLYSFSPHEDALRTEVLESCCIPHRFDSWQLSSVLTEQYRLDKSFTLLREIPILQEVDDCQVIDITSLDKLVLLGHKLTNVTYFPIILTGFINQEGILFRFILFLVRFIKHLYGKKQWIVHESSAAQEVYIFFYDIKEVLSPSFT